jgi:hypothetical protein
MGRDGAAYEVIWVRRERKYFSKQGWTHPKSAEASLAQKSRLPNSSRLITPGVIPRPERKSRFEHQGHDPSFGRFSHCIRTKMHSRL